MSENQAPQQKVAKDEDDSDFEEEMRITEAVEGFENHGPPKQLKPVPEAEVQKLQESAKKPKGPNYPESPENQQRPAEDANFGEKEKS
ncbi:unnamed protein product [Bursaphelenchus xylophilus]|uniref:(pine wood nematode) hypothetical protein n=1 Tax=Bursaphelenchus xylophilus TaxID=6326 RepID=A0A1I7SCU0_BURXY|nr:unnamed protein product [Bursaphelenchus xylophilus]CAG9093489.1 unnamed protein product [Bursaphelenchus xylophilus]